MEAKTKYKLRFISLSLGTGNLLTCSGYRVHENKVPIAPLVHEDMSRCKINMAAMKINPVVTG